MFIALAYAAALLIVAGLIAWVIADHRMQRRKLRDFEARGIVRRSARSGTPAS
jgi:heme exporter protein CcmD